MTAELSRFERGDQIAYIPRHAKGDINHPDVEYGFVTSVRGNMVFCRFWYNVRGGRHQGELRTTANSQSVRRELLVRRDYKPQEDVDELLEHIAQSKDVIFRT